MDLHTELITDFSLIETIYNECITRDFLRDELKPLPMIQKKWKAHQYDCFGLYNGEKLIGYAYFFKCTSIAGLRYYLFDYFAILPQYRNKGYGAVYLSQLSDMITDADCMVLEADDPNRAEDGSLRELQQRRIDFYLRNGCINTGITVRLFGVHYILLEVPCGGDSHDEEEIRAVYETLYRDLLTNQMLNKSFKWT